MADVNYSWSYPGSWRVDIPANARNINVYVAGAGGGNGGFDSSTYGGSGGDGRSGYFTINQRDYAYSLTFYAGSRGQDGADSRTGSGSGSGGSSQASGGRGGNTGPTGTSGGGGGGGAASTVYDSSTGGFIIICSGGGGGGGGSNGPRGRDGGVGYGIGGGATGGNLNVSGGRDGGDCPSDGGGGGGGGGGAASGGPVDTTVYYRLDSSQDVSFSVIEQSGYFLNLNIQGVKNFPENNDPNPETIYVNAGTYLVTAASDQAGAATVRVDPSNSQRAQANDGGGSWDDIEVTASAGIFQLGNGSSLGPGSGGNYGLDPTSGNVDALGGYGGSSGYNTNRANFVSSASGLEGNGAVSISYDNPLLYGCTDPAASNYNPNATNNDGSCTYPVPSISFNSNTLFVCAGGSATLSWSVSNATSISISNIGSVASSGSTSVSPGVSTTYTLTATGAGGTTTQNVDIVVYQYANVTLSANRTTIIRGESVTLTWITTGNATTANLSPILGATNINGATSFSPTTTTTYTISVTGACNNDSDQVTVTVLQSPTLSVTGPVNTTYGNQVSISYSTTNTQSLTGTATYYDTRGQFTTGNLNITVLPSGIYNTLIPYNNYGPREVQYNFTATGNGLTTTASYILTINIDETPNNVIIPDSDGVFKDEEIVTPDETVTSYKVQINDIDIPVEIKSDHPIQVDIDDQDNWTSIRQI